MHNLYKLTCEELENLDRKAMNGDLSRGEFEYMSDLIGAKKDMLKIGEMEEESEGYSSMNGGSYERGYSRDGRMYNRSSSYARNGRGRGSNARRDSMGRYSSGNYSYNDEVVTGLRELMDDAPDEQTRREIEKAVTKIERM